MTSHSHAVSLPQQGPDLRCNVMRHHIAVLRSLDAIMRTCICLIGLLSIGSA